MNSNITNLTFDSSNREMCYAYDLISKTNKSFFLTGRAGTGKTTFLKNVQESVSKNFIVLAPSGVAAIHAGGQTIHSFFGLDLGVQGPRSYGSMNSDKIALVQNVDTIIIDEVSMVRCDIMDAVDRMLRHCRHSCLPFGGVQMVLVGDIFQLPPVVTQEDFKTLRRIYDSDYMFFYKARCVENNPLPKIEFQKIYRQNDLRFIEILDHFRMGRVGLNDLEEINSHVASDDSEEDSSEMRITLTTFRKDAKIINDTRLMEIDKEEFSFDAIYDGKAERLRDVVEDNLILKEGAQVMFLRNDDLGRWANGTIAKVSFVDENSISVILDNGSEEVVCREIWEAYEYEYDEKAKVCTKKVVGQVTQFPLRLAWAITIHKSQSLTFDKVAIDFGRGAFSCGQAYVALSRCRSLEGLRLVRRIGLNSIRVSHDALSFASTYNDEKVISAELSIGEAVNEYERKGDYDGAATTLFSMCDIEAHSGNVLYAYDLMNRAMSYLADDTCLFGQDWKVIPNDSKESVLLNAAGLLYSERTDEAIRLLISTVSASDCNFNGIYLLARALELKKDWDTVEALYNQMIEIYRTTIDNGLDSAAFRKFKYRLAVLNESHYGDPGVEIMVRLIVENPRYDKYHTDLRWILQKRCSEQKAVSEEANPLIAALLDKNISRDDFLSAIRRERHGKSVVWRTYLQYISQLKIHSIK